MTRRGESIHCGRWGCRNDESGHIQFFCLRQRLPVWCPYHHSRRGNHEVAEAAREEIGPGPSDGVSPLPCELTPEHCFGSREHDVVVGAALEGQLAGDEVNYLFHYKTRLKAVQVPP